MRTYIMKYPAVFLLALRAVILFCAICLVEHQDPAYGCRKRLRRYVTKKKVYQDSYVYNRGYVIEKMIEN